MSEDKEEIKKKYRENKIEVIKLLAEQMVQLKFNQYKDFKIAEDKSIAYYDATIDLLKKEVKNAKQTEAKLIKFDKLEADRKNLTPEELKQLQEEQDWINKKVDSILATLDPLASLRGNIHAPNTVILRYRGKGIDNEFLKQYPFGRMM